MPVLLLWVVNKETQRCLWTKNRFWLISTKRSQPSLLLCRQCIALFFFQVSRERAQQNDHSLITNSFSSRVNMRQECVAVFSRWNQGDWVGFSWHFYCFFNSSMMLSWKFTVFVYKLNCKTDTNQLRIHEL